MPALTDLPRLVIECIYEQLHMMLMCELNDEYHYTYEYIYAPYCVSGMLVYKPWGSPAANYRPEHSRLSVFRRGKHGWEWVADLPSAYWGSTRPCIKIDVE